MVLAAGFRDRVVEVLQDLVRIDTTNPPGNEVECALYLRELLSPAGIETQVVESAPGRGNLIARLRGSGEGKPVMLMGHLDVVAASDPDEWTVPPFAGEIRDGYLWGRGSVDMKNMIAASAVVLLALAALPHPLRRDVLFVASADEEHGGEWGMGWLAQQMPELFDVDCAINEGGGSPVTLAGKQYYTCQVAEKGVCRTVWTAQSRGGHGSGPRRDTAPLKLARALCRLGDGYLGGAAIPTMRAAFGDIARQRSELAAEEAERLFEQGRFEEALMAAGLDQQEAQAQRLLFYDTACVTGLRAGDPRQINVIPPRAQAFVDGRILPGRTQEDYLRELQELAGEEVQVEVYEDRFSPGLEASSDAPIIATIREVIAERCDGAPVLPWMCVGSTDAKHLAALGVPVYGFVPSMPLPEGVEEVGAHATDERLWLGNLSFCLDVLYDIVYRYATQR